MLGSKRSLVNMLYFCHFVIEYYFTNGKIKKKKKSVLSLNSFFFILHHNFFNTDSLEKHTVTVATVFISLLFPSEINSIGSRRASTFNRFYMQLMITGADCGLKKVLFSRGSLHNYVMTLYTKLKDY